MHVLSHVDAGAPLPALAWREQAQQRARRLLDVGRDRVARATGHTWPALKAEWRAFVQARCAALRDFAGQPIHPRNVREFAGDGFRVQNIVFESMPGWQVGLNLFLPVGDGPFVPVVCPCGHGAKWLPDHQTAPQVLARRGFAAALFDMPMFGEKTRHNDHFIHGSQAAMAGLWSNLFFLVDAVRVADYLQTRDDIDFSRGMGVTGVSGGGFATLFMGIVDARATALAPVCCVAPLGGHVIDGLYTGCPETCMTGQAALGLDFDHLLCLCAPRPCLVVNGTQDELFRPEQVNQAMAQARRVYEIEGVPERLDQFTENSPHTYTVGMAEQVADWFQRWLGSESATQSTSTPANLCSDIRLLSESDLDCGTRESTDGMLDVVQRRVGALRQSRRSGCSDRDVMRLLGVDLAASGGRTIVEAPATTWGYRWLRKGVAQADDDLPLPFLRAGFPDAPAGVLVAFSDGGKLDALRQGAGLFGLCRTIISADVRGFGELAPEPTDYDMYAWCAVDRAVSDLVLLTGETALGQQARDAWRVLEAAPAGETLTVYGRGEAALPALFAGLVHPRVERIVLDSFLCAFEALATTEAPLWSRYAYLPGVLEVLDLPELIRRRSDRRFLLVNPMDAGKQPLDEMDALKLFGMDDDHVTVHVDGVVQPTPLRDIVRTWLDRVHDDASSAGDRLTGPLAIHGGTPVRASGKPFPTRYLGADWTGVNELRNARRAIGTKTLFRHYGPGKPMMTEQLERTAREKFGARFALATTSGSAALTCALIGLAVGPGDEVILPAFSWFSCYESVVALGALPVFCAIDRSLNLDPDDVARRIGPRTKAVIAVHYQGSLADLNRLMEIARPRGVRLLEDCAQAIGTRYRGRAAGTIGDVGTFSLQGNKLITSGEGGLVLTDDPLIFERAARYHDLGFLRPVFKTQLDGDPQTADFAGSQFRMNETTAAVALAQLGRLDWIIERCRGHWRHLRRRLATDAPHLKLRHSYDEEGDAGITLYLDLESAARAGRFGEALAAEGIPLGPSSGMTNLLRHPMIVDRNMPHPGLPPFGAGEAGRLTDADAEIAIRTDDILNSMVAIPIGPRYRRADVDDIGSAIIKVVNAHV